MLNFLNKLKFGLFYKIIYIRNESIKNGDNKNDINEFYFILKNLWCCSSRNHPQKKFNLVLGIEHTWRCTFVKILLYFEYNT